MRWFLNKNNSLRLTALAVATIGWATSLYLTTKSAGIGLNIGTFTLTLLGVLILHLAHDAYQRYKAGKGNEGENQR